MANNRIKTDAGKLAEALRGKVLGRRGLCGALSVNIGKNFTERTTSVRNEKETNMIEVLTAVIAICAVAMFILSVVIHRAATRNQRQLEILIKATATSILISGRTAGEPDTAVRLFNEQYPLFAKELKFPEE